MCPKTKLLSSTTFRKCMGKMLTSKVSLLMYLSKAILLGVLRVHPRPASLGAILAKEAGANELRATAHYLKVRIFQARQRNNVTFHPSTWAVSSNTAEVCLLALILFSKKPLRAKLWSEPRQATLSWDTSRSCTGSRRLNFAKVCREFF